MMEVCVYEVLSPTSVEIARDDAAAEASREPNAGGWCRPLECTSTDHKMAYVGKQELSPMVQLRGGSVSIAIPQDGDKVGLIHMAIGPRSVEIVAGGVCLRVS